MHAQVPAGFVRMSRQLESDYGGGYLELSETMTTAEACGAETSLRSSGLSGDPALNTNLHPNRCSSGMMRLNVSSICSLGR